MCNTWYQSIADLRINSYNISKHSLEICRLGSIGLGRWCCSLIRRGRYYLQPLITVTFTFLTLGVERPSLVRLRHEPIRSSLKYCMFDASSRSSDATDLLVNRAQPRNPPAQSIPGYIISGLDPGPSVPVPKQISTLSALSHPRVPSS